MPVFRNTPGLLERFRAGSREAMETVYWAYVGRIESLVRVGFRGAHGKAVPGVGRAELEDLVQEIFTRAFSDRARLAFDGLRDYGPFLSTIARNIVVDWARKKGREITFDETSLESALEAGDPREQDALEDLATARVVQAYLEALPADLAAVHRERYVLDHTQEAAAAALGLSRQQLRTREMRLREGLDRALRSDRPK